jgi:hypothetical protein
MAMTAELSTAFDPIHRKKAFRYSRPQPGCHLPNSFIYDVIIPAQGKFGKRDPGWVREYRKAFFTL